ncbi:hypothetical protein E2C06_33205 [Dankookia rubra]|uniref:Uncharacterized protein n=1 Tax=Dankookia rubra TaxID=1442381 RepID=A0A4R5Q7R7_9PROT|nr:hypothetical protein [Dankookia rubra]TDH58321.1 hypothetical protein E2C06_33205 [Dankookia rubra]
MSDSTDKAAEDTPPQGLPACVRAIIAPWWERRARSIAAALEAAGEGEAVEFEGRRHTVEELVAAAERAVEMADRLSETSA